MSGNFGTDIKLLLNKVSLVFLVKLLIYDIIQLDCLFQYQTNRKELKNNKSDTVTKKTDK